MKLAEAQKLKPGAHALGKAIANEDGNIDPVGHFPDLSRMHKAGTLATALGSQEAAEAILGSTKMACDDLVAHRAQVATQQALSARINLLRRTVKIVAPALLALCFLGLWLALH
jgi:hypothetical protein